MVGELSLSKATCLFSRFDTTCSMTSHSMSPPAHSRSEFVIFPSGLLSEITRARTSSGHSSLKTVGIRSMFSPTTMPPTPSFDASTMPIRSGWLDTNSVHLVGLSSTSRSRVLQAYSSLYSSLPTLMNTYGHPSMLASCPASRL